jgi:hypothetical protein
MSEPRKFYKTTFEIVILSQEPIDEIKLEDIAYEVTEGACCLHTFRMEQETHLTGKEMADELRDAGSDPGFFMLNPDGTSENEEPADGVL